MRNFIVKSIFSIPMACHKIANRLAGITISYPDSPLNAGSTCGRCGPRPGQRLIVRHDSQDSHVPHFSLMARDDVKAQNMILRYPYLLKSKICSPSHKNGIWLVRPDGYVAATARDGEWTVIEEFLSNIVVEHDC
ncbi:monooxygenase [Acetobacter pasteurianus]|uniref:Monooxygenase FAD-binding n=1 Tax=Acetobacter pasteurianus (strain NBRC 105184 / IFO 3283-01) TaxID=634452 RepID=C7JE25_ACEP3|nr:monooxygenase [Acetobacter pasteurianus]BAI00209.1 monooxygenase FAD-binding [Acetobacter pasteurianus IFO 3283-01]BAI03262.1 monooxygenase FAD-binding [Acetobacter pasteurianus IFO 3283-03]BAI06307.1 monooxygenase FAD-binding [Acetobacter pasteurianus IFO 3283-07]BAI09357.1 monooxygenase FAD-binding [Acetobacter pasteurianus IFO 3283-22]BAI12405.1 monooxygenase FAD-binding [Acetobacter pasteurianus IFO 3283-26]